MKFLVGHFAITAAVLAALVVLVNAADAAPGIAVVTLSSVAVISGAILGYFADRLPD